MINFKATITYSQLNSLRDNFYALFVKLSKTFFLSSSGDLVLFVRLDNKSCENIRDLVNDFLDEYQLAFETQDYDSIWLIREFIHAILFTFN